MGPPEAPQAVSIWLRNCYVACFQLPPEAPQAVSIGLRNCYVARFEHPLKASKAPQQLSKAFEPQNPPQQLAKASRLLCHGTPRGPTSCVYWASKRLHGTFLDICICLFKIYAFIHFSICVYVYVFIYIYMRIPSCTLEKGSAAPGR